MAQYNGSPGGDFYRGTYRDDEIRGNGGDDTLKGEGGDDLILGGKGNDLLKGGDGHDTLDGGDGCDTLDGGCGDDSLIAGDGRDKVYGGSGDDTLIGGGDSDYLNGGADADTIYVTHDPTAPCFSYTYVDGDCRGDDNDTLDLSQMLASGYVIKSLHTTPESRGSDGFDGKVELYNAGTGDHAKVTFRDIENLVICFTPGTAIATPHGEVPVEDLCEGDRVFTRDNGVQTIRWAGRKRLDAAALCADPSLRPVTIRKGALGNGLPERDLTVSPCHRMLIHSDRAAMYFDEREVLAAAKHLTGIPGVERVTSDAVSYHHILFDHHEVILANGSWSESFQPGDHSLCGLGAEQRNEIFKLFPDLEMQGGLDAYAAARRTLRRHEARLVVDVLS